MGLVHFNQALFLPPDVGCATSRTTAATTPTRTRRCAPADTENVPSPSSGAETESVFPVGGDATSTTIAATAPMNWSVEST